MEVGAKIVLEFWDATVGLQVEVFVLDRAPTAARQKHNPKPYPCPFIYADEVLAFKQALGELPAGELHSPVSIKHKRSLIHESILYGSGSEGHIEGIGRLFREDYWFEQSTIATMCRNPTGFCTKVMAG